MNIDPTVNHAELIDIDDSGSIITATEVEGALQENRTALDLNTTHRGSSGTDHSLLSATAGTAAANKASILGISKETDTVIASTELISGKINTEIDPTPVTVDLADKAIKYYRFKGNKTCEFGGADITLASGTETYITGPPQMAVFDDSTYYTNPYDPTTKAISISFLMRPTTATTQGVVGIGDDDAGVEYFHGRLQADGKFRMQSAGLTARNGDFVHTLNILYHIVVTIPADRNWANVKVYTNGVAETVSAQAGTINLAGAGLFLVMGSQANGVANNFNGDISDVTVYEHVSDVLTPTQVLALYNGQKLATNLGGDLTVTDDANIGGALNHDGSTVGFFGITPGSRQDVTDLNELLIALDLIGIISDGR